MSRIGLKDSTTDLIVKMAEGNPGAVSAIVYILEGGSRIDPQAAMGGMGKVLLLDTWEIYGEDIYTLWNDKCERSLRKMLILMRSCQLGNFSNSKLKAMASDKERKINLTEDEWKEHDDFVCGKLDQFEKSS